MKDNEDQSYIAQEPCDMLNTIEYDLFMVRVKQYIIVVTLREYIQESIRVHWKQWLTHLDLEYSGNNY